MNTNTLKKFAQEARQYLLQQVTAKLEYVLNQDTAALREKKAQIQKLKGKIKQIGKEQVVETVAYTWFNRLMALRFMDANDYQPSGIRIVSPQEGRSLPQLLEEAKQAYFPDEIAVDKQKVLALLDGKLPSNNPQNEAYRYLLIAACNALHQQFSFLFEPINDYAELLLPDDLTSEFSIVHKVVEGMSEEDCKEVEIIGWMYQFYISEKKDKVFAAKGKVKKEDIPAATQLFTPRWIVEYMVQNTLGKLWLQNRPNSRLREHMPYFIESASLQSKDYLKIDSPEEIKLLDQACGSGHILVYAFELLTRIYEEEGYSSSNIPKLIIEKNLYGFEIDQRAAQLAGLSLLMKARGYYRRLFRKELHPNILCFKDVYFTEKELQEIAILLNIEVGQELKHDLQLMEQATNFGSLIQPNTIPSLLQEILRVIEDNYSKVNVFEKNLLECLKPALTQLQLLNEKFHCVVDNPPYMGGGNMNKSLADFVNKYYPDSKPDLMACFMESGIYMLMDKGYMGMINQQAWMFISSYEKLRNKILSDTTIETMIQIGFNSFPSLNSKLALATSFVLSKSKNKEENISVFFNLNDVIESADKKKVFELKLDSLDNYSINQNYFNNIPGKTIAYWLSLNAINNFQLENVDSYAHSFQGIISGNNKKKLRYWSELKSSSIKNDFSSYDTAKGIECWVPYQKGGEYRKWYGNNEFRLRWNGSGDDLTRARTENRNYYFKECITWTFLSLNLATRYVAKGNLWDVSGSSFFTYDHEKSFPMMGLLSSKVGNYYIDALNPTLNYQVENILKVPIIKDLFNDDICKYCENAILISRFEWDSRETSWDFQKSELLRLKSQTLEDSYKRYCDYWTKQFHQLHQNEEDLNRQFIEIYGLQDELTPDVPLKDITILKAETSIENGKLVFDAKEVFAQLVSYAVGCMFGRYSLDKEGLILANQGETLQDFEEKVLGGEALGVGELGVSGLGVGEENDPTTANSQQLIPKILKPKTQLSFVPDDDGIIPILDDEWFADDIVGRCHEFLKVSFGEAHFQENLTYLETQLGKKLRKYFVRDFYNDHIKRYKKRPIYWLFSSPKGSFSVLVYLHRYTPDTLNNILNNYLREFIQKLKAHKKHKENIQVSGSASEKNKAIKAVDKLDKMILDCEVYERDILYPLATERIELDLDDGVLVNYNKMGKAVKMVTGLNDKKTKDKVRKFDWIEVSEIRG